MSKDISGERVSFVSSVFIVSGCAMGAGCLAMPMFASGPNFLLSAFLLIISGILSYYLATVSLEIFIKYKNGTNLSTIATKNFKSFGFLSSGLTNVLLMYSILSVYMIGGADLLNKTIFPAIHIKVSTHLTLPLFLLFTIPIFFKGESLIIDANKIVFYVKLFSFLFAVFIGLRFFSTSLFHMEITYFKYIWQCIPIFLLSLWFHFSIPVIAEINNYNRKRCELIFKIGIAIPVVLYISWVAVILSLIPRFGTNSFYSLLASKQTIGTMIYYAAHNNKDLPQTLGFLINVFANVAILTSFFIVGLSNYEYLRDAFKIPQNIAGRVLNLVVTFVPSIILTIFKPNGFVLVLQQATIILLLINIITISCVIKEYNSLDTKYSKSFIYFLIFILIFIIALQVLDNFGFLPSFGVN